MDNTKKNIFNALKNKFAVLSNSQKIKISIMFIVLAVIGVLYINYKSTNVSVQTHDAVSDYYVSSINYCKTIEDRLKNVLGNMQGVDNVEVMVTLDSSMELVFANTEEEKTNLSSLSQSSNSYTVVVSTPIIIDTKDGEKPIVVKEVLPKVKGVLVVCKGAENINTKLNIIQAVKSLLNINNSNIQVISGK